MGAQLKNVYCIICGEIIHGKYPRFNLDFKPELTIQRIAGHICFKCGDKLVENRKKIKGITILEYPTKW